MKAVLIIEDETPVRTLLERILKSIDKDLKVYSPFPVGNLNFKEITLEVIKRDDNINLILLDIELSSEIGFEIAKAIKEMKKNIPIILMSGNPNALECQGKFEEYRDYLKFVDERIEKPFKLEEIEKIIKKFLDQEVIHELK